MIKHTETDSFALKEVSKSFGKKEILKDISISFSSGTITGIYGDNGTGKSTLLRLLAGIYAKDKGQIDRPQPLSRTVYLTSETRSFYERLTGWQNLDFFRSLFKISIHRNEIELLAAKLSLEKMLSQKLSCFSLGQKHKFGWLVALIRSPKIVLIDEGFDHLDDISIDFLQKQLEVLKNSGSTVLFVSRARKNLPRNCDHLFQLDSGRIVEAR